MTMTAPRREPTATRPSRSSDLHKSFGDNEVLKGIDFDVDHGRGRLRDRARPARASRRCCAASTCSRTPTGGHDLRRGRRDHRPGRRPRRGPPPDRHGVPAVQPLPAPDRAAATSRIAQQQGAAAAARPRPSRSPGANLDRVGLADKERRLPGPALRRPAAAGRDRPGAVDGPGHDALRRAHLGPRPRAGRRRARRSCRTWPPRA